MTILLSFLIHHTHHPIVMAHTSYLLKSTLVAAGLIFSLPLLAADLRVRIEGITEKGSLHVYVFTAAEGFPKEEHAVVHQVHPRPVAAQNELTIQMAVPDSTEYAVMAFQDKDGDGKMNRLFGMIPQEPYGLSRNPKVLGKPKFSDAAVKASDNEVIVLKLNE